LIRHQIFDQSVALSGNLRWQTIVYGTVFSVTVPLLEMLLPMVTR